jgi:hypothetical protein
VAIFAFLRGRRVNHFCVIDRREGTVAASGPSNLAAGTDHEVRIGQRGGHGARSGLGCGGAWPERTNPGRRVTEKEGCDEES